MASLMDLIAGYSLPNGLLNMNYKTRNRAGQPVQPSTDTITNAITEGLLPMLASAGIGTGAGIAGQFGDAENLGRLAINKLGGNVNPNTTLPTQEGILSYINSITPLKPYTDNTYTKIGANLLAPILDPTALITTARASKPVAKAVGEHAWNKTEDMMRQQGLMPSVVPRDEAEDFAKQIRNMGFEANVTHSGSKAGLSSYVNVSDPITGRFIQYPYRFSDHSKGPFQQQFVNSVTDYEKQLPEIQKSILAMREMGVSPTLLLQQQQQKQVDELVSGGMKPRTAWKQVLETKNEPSRKDINNLESVVSPLKEKGITLDIYESKNNPDKLVLSKIEVPKELRQSGVGTNAMQELAGFADKQNKTITLSPSTDFGGTSVNRLKDFYKRFGFVENKGRNKDFSISESMYRLPTKPSRK